MKRTKYLFMGLFCFGLAVTGVSAYYQNSGLRISPKFKLNANVSGPQYALKTQGENMLGKNVGVYYTYLGELESTYNSVGTHGRRIDIYLMEADGNPHDEVKTYVGKFTNRELVTIVLDEIINQGQIEADGDQIGEFYIKGYLQKIGNETNYGSGTELFYYDIQTQV